MKVTIPITDEHKVKACIECNSYFFNWKMLFLGKQPVCLRTAPKVPQDLITGSAGKIELDLIKTCQVERAEEGACGEIGRRWEKIPMESDYGI